MPKQKLSMESEAPRTRRTKRTKDVLLSSENLPDEKIIPKKETREKPETKGKTSKRATESLKSSVFSKKVDEFNSLASSDPDLLKLISENKLTVGAHVSVAKGVFNGLINAFKIRASAMAFFVTQPRKWTTEKGKF